MVPFVWMILMFTCIGQFTTECNDGTSLAKHIHYLEGDTYEDIGPIVNRMRVEDNGIERKPMDDRVGNNPFDRISEIRNDEIDINEGKTVKRSIKQRSLWPKSKIPYFIDTSKIPSHEHHALIHDAIDILKSLTCIDFIPDNPSRAAELGHSNSVNFTITKECMAVVGMQGKGQYISLEIPSCMKIGTILHEMLHALGVGHEQERYDRDYYIRLLNNYVGKASSIPFTYGPYDLQSIMQYSLVVFGEKVMDVIDQNQVFLVDTRNPHTLQFYDIMDLTRMYNCTGHCVSPPECLHGGFLNHRCKCFCPDHIKGERCEIVETDPGCGGILEVAVGQEVSITTPNYPNKYDVNVTCRWLLKGEPGYYVRIVIDEMHLPYDNLDRCYHWLEIQYNNPGHPGILRCGDASGLSFTASRDSPEILIITLDTTHNPSVEAGKGAVVRSFAVGNHCLVNPCHYGICKEEAYGFQCECSRGFSGQFCEYIEAGHAIECDFDEDKPCLFVNTPQGDQFDWTHKKYAPNYPDTGPKHAHSGHGYMIIDTSPPRIQGEIAHLVSILHLPEEDRCLSFYYNMHGQFVETLSVKATAINGTFIPMWTASGNKGLIWHFAQVFLPKTKNLKIVFEAVSGLNYSSSIALDTISLTPGECDIEAHLHDVVQIKSYLKNGYVPLNEYGMTFESIGWINFDVHGCYDAKVKLETETKTESYYMVLGAGFNTWAHVYKYKNGVITNMITSHIPILDCNKFSQFWFGWKDNVLQMGRGGVYGENVLASKSDTEPLNIKFVSVKSPITMQWNFPKGNCISGFWKCKDTGYCLIPIERCDNIPQCGDASDEQDCVFPKCTNSEFRCTYGRCYPESVRCDGKQDCTDHSDEKDCPVYLIPYSKAVVSALGVSVPQDTIFKFTVKSCNNVWIALLKNGAVIYEAGIGRGNNSWSTLTKYRGPSVSHQGTFLICDKYLPFYVSWAGSIVQVGQGHEQGQNVIFQMDGNTITHFDDIQIRSFVKEAFYNLEAALPACEPKTEFRCEFGRCIPATYKCDGIPHCTDLADEKDCPIFVTPGKPVSISNFNYNISGLRWINFKVKGCSNAFIELFANGERVYYVMLGRGGNTWNSLHCQKDYVKSDYITEAVLDCNSFKDFWFSWMNNNVQVGKGLNKGKHLLLEFHDNTSVAIDDVVLASFWHPLEFHIRQGNCFEGMFQCKSAYICIPRDQVCNGQLNCFDKSDEMNCVYPPCNPDSEFRCGYGKCLPIDVRCDKVLDCTDGSDELDCPIITQPRESKRIEINTTLNWMNFKVKTCSDAIVLLTKNNTTVYRAILGRGGNTWSSLQSTKHHFTWRVGVILDCDAYRSFWISWENGRIRLGKGLNRKENIYMRLNDKDFIGVDGVYIMSYRVTGEWFHEEGNCFPGMFRCTERQMCIPIKEQCNGRSECVDSGGSDEKSCGPCNDNEFQCDFGLCIPSDKRCNDENDCWDNSDEKNCPIRIPVLYLSHYIDLGSHGVSIDGKDTLYFTAESCGGIWLALMTDKLNTTAMYTIGIGRGGNKFNTIRKNGTDVKTNYITALDCTKKQLWVTWKNGRIAVGTDTDVTQNIIIEFIDEKPLVIKDIGVSSWNKAWIFTNVDI